jgi:hypothetical protein
VVEVEVGEQNRNLLGLGQRFRQAMDVTWIRGTWVQDGHLAVPYEMRSGALQREEPRVVRLDDTGLHRPPPESGGTD